MRSGRCILRTVIHIFPSGEYRRDGREFARYYFRECKHAQTNLRMDGIITAMCVAWAEEGKVDYPRRKCWECSSIAEGEDRVRGH